MYSEVARWNISQGPNMKQKAQAKGLIGDNPMKELFEQVNKSKKSNMTW